VIARDVISGVLMLAGAGFCLVGAYGMLRFPDVLSRLQAATKPQTVGLLLVLAGVAVQLGIPESTSLLLVALLQVTTAPVLSQLVGRAAYLTGAADRSSLAVDELETRLRRESSGEAG
jgi:multicomponent Na+:H+ antiporter subunit G